MYVTYSWIMPFKESVKSEVFLYYTQNRKCLGFEGWTLIFLNIKENYIRCEISMKGLLLWEMNLFDLEFYLEYFIPIINSSL